MGKNDNDNDNEIEQLCDSIRFKYDADVIQLAAFRCFVSNVLSCVQNVRKEDIEQQTAFLDYLVEQHAEMCAISKDELEKAELIISKTSVVASHLGSQSKPISDEANRATSTILARFAR